MTLIVENQAAYVDPTAPIKLLPGDDLQFTWDAISASAGLGREALGQEPVGFGGAVADDAIYTVIEVLTTDGDLVSVKGPIYPWEAQTFTYTAAQNVADHGGYQTANRFKFIQLGAGGRRTELAQVYTA